MLCLKKPGREFRDAVELALAWQRVQRDIDQGMLGGDFDRTERADLQAKVREAKKLPQTKSGPATATWCWRITRSPMGSK